MDVLDLVLHLLAQLLVERAERLVHQHELGLEHQRAGDRDPLLLAARELARPAAARSPPSCTMSSARATRASISALASLRTSSGKARFSADRHVREQRVVLEHHADVAPVRRHVVDRLGRRARSRHRSRSRSRRASSGRWSCPSPTGRAGSGTRRARRPGSGFRRPASRRRSSSARPGTERRPRCAPMPPPARIRSAAWTSCARGSLV